MSRDILNLEQYEEYKKEVEAFFTRENIEGFSCGTLEEPDGECEPYFSWQPCMCCQGTLGGNRHDVIAYNEIDKTIYEYSVCDDCVYYCEYGKLDDTTMLRIEANEV